MPGPAPRPFPSAGLAGSRLRAKLAYLLTPQLTLDASSPAIVYSASTPVQVTFTPPANSRLIVAWCGNTQTATDTGPPSITDSLGTPLTYTQLQHGRRSDGSPTCDRCVTMFTAVVVNSAAMTISVTNNAITFHESSVKVWVWTDRSGNVPTMGTSAKGAQTTGTTVAASYTATLAGSRGMAVVDDWDSKGVETAGAGSTLTGGGSAQQATTISYAYVLRTDADGVAGVVTTLNTNLPSASANLGWVAAEVGPGVAPDPPVAPDAEVANSTGVGTDAVAALTVADSGATATGTALDATVAIGAPAGNAAATGAAFNAPFGLTLDPSSPAAVVDANTTTVSGTFSPPALSLLVAFVMADANTGSAVEACTVFSTGGLSWFLKARNNGSPGSTVEVWYASAVSAPGAITVSVTDNQGAVDKRLLVRVFTDSRGIPAGLGATTSTATQSAAYTSTVAGSLGMAVGLGTGGTPVPGSGQTLADFDTTFDGGDGTWVTTQSATTPVAGTTVTMNVTAPSTVVHHLAVEILPASLGANPAAENAAGTGAAPDVLAAVSVLDSGAVATGAGLDAPVALAANDSGAVASGAALGVTATSTVSVAAELATATGIAI